MGPLGFLTGVVLGSAASIAAVLLMVGVIFLAASSDHPALLEEYGPLFRAAGWFTVLAVASAAAFYGVQKHTRWRWPAQAAMWATVAAIALAYWPEPVA